MKQLHLSPDLNFPLDTVTSTGVILGGKGMGKTNLGAGALPEELFKAGLPFAIIDTMGVDWGLRFGADKSSRGIEVLILGGPHGDIPIEPTAGKVIADLVVDENVSVVIDVSRHVSGKMWSKGESIRFVADFCERLFERQGEKRQPRLLIVDEIARYAPQIIPHGSPDVARCLGILETLAEQGRNVALGFWMMTVRSARLNKNLSELADTMIAFRAVGPKSLAAIMEWLGEHVDRERHKDIATKLRALPRGSALVVSPGWLGYEGIVKFRLRHTFDSSKTPEIGKTLQAPGQAAKPDLAKYQERMAATIEKAKAEDPRALRAQVAELQRQLRASHGALEKTLDRPLVEARVEVPVLKDAQIKRLEGLLARAEKAIEGASKAYGLFAAAVGETHEILRRAPRLAASATRAETAARPAPSFATSQTRPIPAKADADVSGSVLPAQQRILNVLAWLESVRLVPADRRQLALLAGASPTSSSYTNNLGALRTAGLIDYPQGGTAILTDQGRSVAVIADTPRTTDALHQAVLSKLPPAQQKILTSVLTAYPKELLKEQIAEEAGASPTSSSFTNNLGALRSLGVIDYPSRGFVKAAAIMFLEAVAA